MKNKGIFLFGAKINNIGISIQFIYNSEQDEIVLSFVIGNINFGIGYSF